MLSETEQSILATLLYFDFQEFPLTLSEIKKYLFFPGFEKTGSPDLRELENMLSGKLSRYVSRVDGFYFLAGREEILKIRAERYRAAAGKLRRAKFFARLFAPFPFIRAVALSGSLSLLNSDEGGDIDFFILTAPGRAWTARFFLNTFVRLFGLHPTEKNRRDKICLSFVVDEDNLDLSAFLMPSSENIPDIHYVYWASQFLPLWGGETFKKFFAANGWIREYLPNWEPVISAPEILAAPIFGGRTLQKFFEKYAGKEKFYKKIQMRILPDEVKKIMNLDTRVVVAGGIIKLHTNDRRAEYRKKYFAALQKF